MHVGESLNVLTVLYILNPERHSSLWRYTVSFTGVMLSAALWGLPLVDQLFLCNSACFIWKAMAHVARIPHSRVGVKHSLLSLPWGQLWVPQEDQSVALWCHVCLILHLWCLKCEEKDEIYSVISCEQIAFDVFLLWRTAVWLLCVQYEVQKVQCHFKPRTKSTDIASKAVTIYFAKCLLWVGVWLHLVFFSKCIF